MDSFTKFVLTLQEYASLSKGGYDPYNSYDAILDAWYGPVNFPKRQAG